MDNNLFKNKYRVSTVRHKNWDYTKAGVYFITICTRDFIPYFGEIRNQKMMLNNLGIICQREWLKTVKMRSNVKLDEFIIMPNHIHGIIIINSVDPFVETHSYASLPKVEYKNKFGSQSRNLSSIIRGFKAAVKKYAVINGINFEWQPRFYDHIIWHEKELMNIREYIRNNPLKWDLDRNNPEKIVNIN